MSRCGVGATAGISQANPANVGSVCHTHFACQAAPPGAAVGTHLVNALHDAGDDLQEVCSKNRVRALSTEAQRGMSGCSCAWLGLITFRCHPWLGSGLDVLFLHTSLAHYASSNVQ